MFRCCILPLLVVGSFVTTALAQSSADVKLVQQKLAEYGAGKADGAMGRNTRNAIRAYQKDWRLPETGKITPDLILRLKREHPQTKSQWFKVSGMNCEVWNSHPAAQEAVTWSGECVSGKANGNGTLVVSWIRKGEEKKYITKEL